MSDKTIRDHILGGDYDGLASPLVACSLKAFGASVLTELKRAGVDINGPLAGNGPMIGALYQIGLWPGPQKQHVWVIPYGGKPTATIGYRGFIRLGYASGYLARITPQIVLTGEEFDWTETQDGPVVSHKVPVTRPDPTPENVLASYVTWTASNGTANGTMVPGWRIRALREKSDRKSPWRSDGFQMMAMKTSVLASVKYWNLSTELQAAMQLEEANDAVIPETPSVDNAAAAKAAIEASGIGVKP